MGIFVVRSNTSVDSGLGVELTVNVCEQNVHGEAAVNVDVER